jgi:hypothetical protein
MNIDWLEQDQADVPPDNQWLTEVRHLTPNSAIFEVESETSLVFAIAVLKKNQCSADLPS